MNPPTATAAYPRRSSRSNSVSSSVNTVRKQSAVSLKSGSRDGMKTRPRSPDRAMTTVANLRYDRSRSRSRPENSLSSNLNINRWSHSTSSSTSAIDTEAVRARANISSRRMSIGLSAAALAAERGQPQSNLARTTSHSPHRTQHSASGFLSVDRTTQPRDGSPAGISPLTPTSMFNTTTTGEYFGDSWQARKTGKSGEAVAMSVHYMRTSVLPQTEEMESSYSVSQSRSNTRDRRTTTMQDDLDNGASSATVARGRSHRSPTQKTMLSKALAKANTAVLLDNAQNIEGAIEAYAEACDLLQQVMVRSSDLEDRKKLSAIRGTYSNRIAELHDLDHSFADLLEKALPEDPPSEETNGSFFASDVPEPDTAQVLENVQIPPRGESLLPEIFGGDSYLKESSGTASRGRLHIPSLAVPMETQYMPPPLSPRRPPSPPSEDREGNTSLVTARPSAIATSILHSREGSTESTSWLDTWEDGESTTSSRLSSMEIGSGGNHSLLDEIESEFDAALDAAVDAAYDDDPSEEPTPKMEKYQELGHSFRSSAPHSHQQDVHNEEMDLTREYDEGDSSDEEERLLEEMTRGYVFDDFSFDKSKSALPRQSDSSIVSGRTWASSVPSTTATNMTTLSTLAESNEPAPEQSPRPIPPAKDSPLMPPPPPRQALPPTPTLPLPPQPGSRPTSLDKYGGIPLRDRRLSGQNGKQLKIDTYKRRSSSAQPSKGVGLTATLPSLDIPPTSDKFKVPLTAPLEDTNAFSAVSQSISPMTAVPSTEIAVGGISVMKATGSNQETSHGSIEESLTQPSSPERVAREMPPPATMKKNLSSSSLRMRNLSVATTDTNNESPITPISANFTAEKKAVPPLPTPSATAFGPNVLGAQLLGGGGMYLFDDHINVTDAPQSPKSPSSISSTAPAMLEPCPESFLLRPFWLMRCLFQTISHPRGGYISTKLFIPRDIWRVRNVKLKALDDKVAQCDLLSAALLKLAKADTFDADAVLEELQSFEIVLDQVRSTLQKRVGNDVGFSGSSGLFRAGGEDLDAGSNKTTNSTAKTFASGWRKLRSKSSTPAIGGNGSKDSGAPITMPSLPMTSSSSVPSSRSQRRMGPPPTPTQLTHIQPPHAVYMSSLARLFEAAQVLDGIARQVEDPGLKCSNKTQVGLELGVKNAAEFFAFYVIRFVMADLMLLVDKFLKRGSEWVMG